MRRAGRKPGVVKQIKHRTRGDRAGTVRPQTKKNLNEHHILPRCRGGGNENNVVVLPEREHKAWHEFFGHLRPEEAVVFLRLVLQPGTTWTRRQLEELRKRIARGATE